MELDELFVATARRLFETVPGSAAQRSANQWLVAFQRSADAWRVSLHVLQCTTLQPGAADERRVPPTVLVVTMQLLRFKVSHAWTEIGQEQRDIVRQTLVAWLAQGPTATATPPAIRVACVIVADLVVKMHAHGWPQWHLELQQTLNQHESPVGLTKLLEIYGAIPAQLQATMAATSDPVQITNVFQAQVAEIARVAQRALSAGDSVRECALRCIEHWCVGCVSSCPELGMDAALLAESALLPALLTLGMQDGEQAASEIVADVFMSTLSEPNSISPKVAAAVVSTVSYLLVLLQKLQSTQPTHPLDDTNSVIWQSLAQITTAVGMHHAAIILSSEGRAQFASLRASSDSLPLPIAFLELALACTSYPDPEVAQPTLEFWFFLLDNTAQQGVQVQLLLQAVSPDQLVHILSRLVNSLIQRCRYPQRIIDSQRVPSTSDDDGEVESIVNLRKEVADTMLSLFSKWPTSPASERSVSCVKGMASLLNSSSDVATLDAVLFLLEYTIELFDIDSSGSEDEELDKENGEDTVKVQSSNEGAQLLQQILLDTLNLPNHPLLLRGVARFYQTLSKSLVLPSVVYVRVAHKLSQGLDLEAAYSVCAHTLRDVSKSILQYSEIGDRRELLETLAVKCQHMRMPIQAAGDVLEATFRMADGLLEQDFSVFCNAVLTQLMHHMSAQDVVVAANNTTLLGRAIGGIQRPPLSVALVDQVWPLLTTSIGTHEANRSFRECALGFFHCAVVANPSCPVERLQQVVQYCLRWFSDGISALTPQCLSAIVSNPAARQPRFFSVVAQMIEQTTVVMSGNRLHFDARADGATNRRAIESVFADERVTQQLAPEITEYFALLRHVVRCFPPSLAQEALLTTTLRLSWLLLDVDHQVQDICDAVCNFVVDVGSSDALLSSSPAAADVLTSAAPSLVRAVLAFFGPKRMHYKQRNLWHFLFQLVHSPRLAAPLKPHLHVALTHVLVQEQLLSSSLSPEQSATLAASLLRTTQRHRFISLLTQTAKQVEALANA